MGNCEGGGGKRKSADLMSVLGNKKSLKSICALRTPEPSSCMAVISRHYLVEGSDRPPQVFP